jgi:hypothetical protein
MLGGEASPRKLIKEGLRLNNMLRGPDTGAANPSFRRPACDNGGLASPRVPTETPVLGSGPSNESARRTTGYLFFVPLTSVATSLNPLLMGFSFASGRVLSNFRRTALGATLTPASSMGSSLASPRSAA